MLYGGKNQPQLTQRITQSSQRKKLKCPYLPYMVVFLLVCLPTQLRVEPLFLTQNLTKNYLIKFWLMVMLQILVLCFIRL